MTTTVRLLWGSLLFILLTSCPSARAQEGDAPRSATRAGEIREVRGDAVTVVMENGETRTVELDANLKLARVAPVDREALRTNQSVVIHGRREGAAVRAAMIAITEGAPPKPMPGSAASSEAPAANGAAANRPVMGTIVSLDPLTVHTLLGDTTAVTFTDRTRVLREGRLDRSELKPGDKVRLMPGRLAVLSTVSAVTGGDSNPSAPAVPSAAGQKRPGVLPWPPEVSVSRFDPAVVTRSWPSPFGIKDANMLRMDVFSFYEGYADSMNELGIHWLEPAASFGFHWNLAQRVQDDGTYSPFDWSRQDRLVKHAQANNIQISAILNAVPPQSGKTRHEVPGLPKDMNGYLAFVKAAVERYDGDGTNDMPGLRWPIKYWKVEDEAVVPLYWQGSGADYAALLSTVYPAVKAADPKAIVICSMVRGYPGLGKDPRAFMVDFYDALARLGKTRPYDIMDQHWMVTDPAEPRNRQYLQIRGLIDDVNATAKARGFAVSPFHTLEVAGVFTTETAQVNDMIRRHVYALACGVRRVMWSGLKAIPDAGLDERQQEDVFRRNTLIAGDGTKKLAFHAYRKMVEGLDGVDLSRVELLRAETGGVYVVRFRKAGASLWVTWNDAPQPTGVTLAVPDGVTAVRVMDFVPAAAEGADIRDDALAFPLTSVPVKEKTVTVTVGEHPLLVECTDAGT